MVKFAVHVTLVVLNAFNLLSHFVGSYLLICLYKSGAKTVQQTYLINLSLTEILASLIMLLEDGLHFIPFDNSILTEINRTEKYFYIVIYVTFCVYYWDMILITADRLAATILHMKYPLYWDKGKAMNAVIGTWTVAIVTCIAVSIAYKFTKFNFKKIFTNYVHSIFIFSFMLFVVYTYSYIFHKYKQSRRRPSVYTQNNGRLQSVCGIFCNSKFYITILLVGTFILFMVVPNLIYLFCDLSRSYDTHTVKDIVKIFYQFSFLSDACVYIFMQPAVRATLLTKTGIRRQTIHVMSVHRTIVNNTLALPRVAITTSGV